MENLDLDLGHCITSNNCLKEDPDIMKNYEIHNPTDNEGLYRHIIPNYDETGDLTFELNNEINKVITDIFEKFKPDETPKKYIKNKIEELINIKNEFIDEIIKKNKKKFDNYKSPTPEIESDENCDDYTKNIEYIYDSFETELKEDDKNIEINLDLKLIIVIQLNLKH